MIRFLVPSVVPPDVSLDLTNGAVFFVASTSLAVRHGLRDIVTHPAVSGLSDADRGSVELVLAEALTNIVKHAYDSPDGQIELHLYRSSGRLHCDVFDAGVAMPNGEIPAGLAKPVGRDHDLPEGGFGWFLIRTLTKDLQYTRIDGRNRLSFQLNIEQ